MDGWIGHRWKVDQLVMQLIASSSVSTSLMEMMPLILFHFFSISIFIHIWNVGQGRAFCIRIIQHWKLLNRLPHQGRRKCIDYSWFIDENNSKLYKSKQWTLLSQQSRLHLRIAVFSNFFYRYLLMTAIFIERQRWIYSNGCAKLREQPPPSCFQQKSKLNLFNILLLNNELC